MRSVGFLAHDQSRSSKPKTFLSKEDAERLVSEMAVERLSAKLIRAFAPDSPFLRTRNFCRNFIPEKLAPREIGGVKFKAPPAQNTGVPRTHYLPGRREKFGEWQMQNSL